VQTWHTWWESENQTTTPGNRALSQLINQVNTPLPVQQIVQAVFSIDEVTTFQVQVRLYCGLNCGKKFVKLYLLSHVLRMHLRSSCGLHYSGYSHFFSDCTDLSQSEPWSGRHFNIIGRVIVCLQHPSVTVGCCKQTMTLPVS